MANKLGKIYGTEEDKVTCNFYSKIGACRHGDKCNRIHNKPAISQTILFKHLYTNPQVAIQIAEGNKVSEEDLKETIKHFDEFYEEIFLELTKYGELLELNVCDNLGDHLIGNVFAKFKTEEDAKKALEALKNRLYNGKQIDVEFSPVTNFQECRCRQYEEGKCDRGGFCNFLHLKYVSKKFLQSLFDQMYEEHPEYKARHKHRHHRSRSRNTEEKKRRHRRSSSMSSLDSCDTAKRRRIIDKWNRRFEKTKDEEKMKREIAEARLNLVLLEQKLAESAKNAENLLGQNNNEIDRIDTRYKEMIRNNKNK